MSWGLSWKRPPDSFRLTLSYGSDADHTLDDIYPTTITSVDDDNNPDDQLGYRVDLDWSVGDDDEQVALRLQSQAMATLPPPEDFIKVDLREGNLDNYSVEVVMEIVTRREPLKGVTLSRAGGSGQQNDGGLGVLLKLMKLDLASNIDAEADGNGIVGTAMENYVFADHWRNVSVVSLAGLGLNAFPIEITQLANLDKLYIDYNKLVALPPKIGSLRNLKVLVADYNFLVAVPVELRQCTGLLALSLEHNKLVRPLLDFRAMSELRVLRLFGNPLEFLPDILPLRELRHLSLPNICIIASQNLGSVDVQIEMENNSYFVGSRHKLSSLFSLIFRFSSCHHPLLSSALAKMMQDEENRAVVGKDETALRQLISMISSEDQHVVEQACSALSALASDFSVAMELVKLDIMQPIETVLKSEGLEKVISVLQVVVKLTFASDIVAYKMFAKNMLKTLKSLCAHKSPEVQKLSLFAIGNLAFCLENRQELVKSKSLLELLLHMTAASDSRVCKAAARVLAILGENELLSHAVKGKRVPKCGLRILTMDGGGMKGLATVKMLKEIEKGTGKQIHELFDLICGTSTGGMLAAALGIKLMSLEKCEEIYKELGKLVFADTAPKDNEAVTWRERLDQLYKSSSQSFRVAVHGSKHSACEFERLLKEMCADDDGDLLIESAVKRIPKVFIVSTLVSVSPAQPFVFRNYQYPAGTPEVSFPVSENMTNDGATAATIGAQIGYRRSTFMGSCKHQLWQAIRASSAAPYYLDDFSDGVCRWQDGAIVANNPTIFGIREAQLLWPDTKIDCLVSVGCGSTPAKVRKGGWRYLDTGQVLIESACSVERVEEALNALLAMLPDIKYFRFNPVDERCDMELDETDPTVWLQLENATAEYIQENSMAFTTLAENLLESQDEDNFSADLNSMHLSHGKAASNDNCPTLGIRRGILLVEASQSSDSGNTFRHARVLQTFCTDNRISLSHINIASLTAKTPLNSTCPPPRTSPLSTKRLPSTALPYSPGTTLKQVGEIDSISPVSFNGFQSSKIPVSPPDSPRRKPLPLSVVNLHEKINNLPQVGILHLALQNDTQGAILSWRNDVIVVAEPGELAEKFLQSAKLSLLYILNDTSRKHAASAIKNISTVAGLVSSRPNFQIGSIVHKYIGCQTHVMEDNQEISAYMFRRTIPYVHLIPEDVHSMVGDWRDRIIIFSGILGPTQALTKALLDSGAKAVVCPSSRPEEVQSMLMSSSNDLTSFDTGEEESKYKHIEKASNTSDFGNKDEHETNEEQSTFSGGNHERKLSNFIIKLYDSLYHGRDRADIALEKSVASHPGIKYTCHLPS